jgi:hypothetical protein
VEACAWWPFEIVVRHKSPRCPFLDRAENETPKNSWIESGLLTNWGLDHLCFYVLQMAGCEGVLIQS